jgi:hypothetical protein
MIDERTVCREPFQFISSVCLFHLGRKAAQFIKQRTFEAITRIEVVLRTPAYVSCSFVIFHVWLQSIGRCGANIDTRKGRISATSLLTARPIQRAHRIVC